MRWAHGDRRKRATSRDARRRRRRFRHAAGGSIGIGTVAIALMAGWIFGINPLTIIGVLSGGGSPVPSRREPARRRTAGQRHAGALRLAPCSEHREVWTDVFQTGRPTLPAAHARALPRQPRPRPADGPVGDGAVLLPRRPEVYIDLRFFDTHAHPARRPGDFAQAYVIAHEVGHHVQHLLGITDKVDAERRRQSEAQANAMSVRVELQADCFAGVWAASRSRSQAGSSRATSRRRSMPPRRSATTRCSASQGTVVPGSFTHGTSAQRVQLVQARHGTGRMADCNTFDARQL